MKGSGSNIFIYIAVAIGIIISIIAMVLVIVLKGPKGDKGDKGDYGSTSLLNGKGVPASTLGVTGDFYIDTDTYTIYGPKTSAWGSGTSMIGPTGSRGSSVLNGLGVPALAVGIIGDFYIDTVTYNIYGPKTTAWGSGTPLIGIIGKSNAKFYMNGEFIFNNTAYQLVCANKKDNNSVVVYSGTDDIVMDKYGKFTYTGTNPKNFIFEYCIYGGYINLNLPTYYI